MEDFNLNLDNALKFFDYKEFEQKIYILHFHGKQDIIKCTFFYIFRGPFSYNSIIPFTVTLMLGKEVSIKDGVDLSHLKSQISKLLALFNRKGKVSKIDLFFNKSL